VTSPHQFSSTGSPDRLDIKLRQNQLMIVKVWDVAEYVRTPTNKDGMVRIAGRDPFPNRAVRAMVVDITGNNGAGVLYPETWFQAASMMKPMGKWKGQLKLVSWVQAQEPKDAYGNPAQTNPYSINDHSGDPAAIATAQAWLAAHPEFDTVAPPEPYDGKPPAPEVPQTQQDPWAQGPQQPYYGQQPGYGQPPQQWQPPVPPQQPPSQWNTAAPPPEYYTQQPQWAQQQQQQPYQQGPQVPVNPQYPQGPQVRMGVQMPPQQPQGPYGGPPAQQGPPQQQWQQQPQQQAPQGAPGSFFDAAQGQPTPNTPQWQGGFNQQTDTPPF
jgi:hypothetical protein